MEKGKRLKILLYILGVFFGIASGQSFVQTASAVPIGSAHSQGATITRNYFIYTALGTNNRTTVYRCNRSGDYISGCRAIITNGNFGHANVIDHEWGTNYFRVEGGGCYNLAGRRAADSKCKSNPVNWIVDSGGLVGQGRTQYGEFRLKAFGSTHSSSMRIVVRQKQNSGSYKTIKVISMPNGPFVDGDYSPEIEDVMVDGDTGEIYYTKSGCYYAACLYGGGYDQEVRLYKYSGYRLPTAENNTPIKTAKEKARRERALERARERERKRKERQERQAANSGSSTTGSSGGQNANTSGGANTAAGGTVRDGCVKTAILGNGQQVCDDGSGNSIKHILDLVVDILTIGIGILGVLGIVIVGIQYLTAGGNEEKTRKAKRRLFEIVIGLVLYVMIYAIVSWLMKS